MPGFVISCLDGVINWSVGETQISGDPISEFYAFLAKLADLWVISGDSKPSDAIVVTGGALDVRPLAAAALFREKVAPLILVARSKADGGREAMQMRKRLLAGGVPSHAVADFEIVLHSTYGEARGVTDCAEALGLRRIVVPVEIFQTRRFRWIFQRELAGKAVEVSVKAIVPPHYNTKNWWQKRLGRMNFRNEVIKYLYYRLRY